MQVDEPRPKPPAYVVVCRGPHCRERGSKMLRARLVELVGTRDDVRLLGYNCFGQCERGPNVAFFPEGVWYGGLSCADDAERVVAHATGIRRLDAERLCLPEGERREHLRNIDDLVAMSERDRRRRGQPRHRWWPF